MAAAAAAMAAAVALAAVSVAAAPTGAQPVFRCSCRGATAAEVAEEATTAATGDAAASAATGAAAGAAASKSSSKTRKSSSEIGSKSCSSFPDTGGSSSEVMPTCLQSCEAIMNHFELTGTSPFMSKIANLCRGDRGFIA